ncbi:Spy/CpxP family protein refolding chaperone [Vampirovibrio chlorellavorus]|uniref:Spy/CpxP family protein refolding chaperone n=1 Tax=Vampirovibrio chlorellavorus TaxID=758823 RepID=UPI0026EDE39E|nr:Spy/CpxP family protein refolding chaperone [Vampirovibrio chlorellavorus]
MKSLEFLKSPAQKRNQAGMVLRTALLAASLFSMAHAGEINWQVLNLTPQQSTQMQTLEDGWHKVHQNLSTQIQRDMAELKTILPTGDSQKIRELQTRIMTNKTYLMNESMDTFLKKREMLSPEQRSQLQKMLPCASTPDAAPAAPQSDAQANTAASPAAAARSASPPAATVPLVAPPAPIADQQQAQD